jgi:hypothetical protein
MVDRPGSLTNTTLHLISVNRNRPSHPYLAIHQLDAWSVIQPSDRPFHPYLAINMMDTWSVIQPRVMPYSPRYLSSQPCTSLNQKIEFWGDNIQWFSFGK